MAYASRARAKRSTAAVTRWKLGRAAWAAAVLVFFACVLAVTAHADTGTGGPPSPGPIIPICPQPDAGPSPLPPDLPAGPTVAAGTVPGSFSVSSTGEAIYSMPLVAPPGRAGMEPKLSVTYDSAAGEGPLGLGFAISGLSAITRCPRNMAQDGFIQAVRDEESDALCLDGMRLVSPSFNIDELTFLAEYRTFPDTFTRIVTDFGYDEGFGGPRGPRSFTAYTKAGLVVEYGSTDNGRVLARNGAVRSWLVTRVSDRYGNTIDTSYVNDRHPSEGYTVEHAPARIRYTGHPSAPANRSVTFEYAPLEESEVRTLYARGMALRRSLRLDRVKMFGPGSSPVPGIAPLREYRFSYGAGPSTGRRLLQTVEECAGDGVCKPPTRFTWHHDGMPGYAEETTPVEIPVSKLASAMMLDVTGDGLDDLVVPDSDNTGGTELAVTNWLVAPNLGPTQPGWFDEATIARQDAYYDTEIKPDTGSPIDYNQDGQMDVLLHDVHGQYQSWQVLIAQPDHSFDRVDTGIYRIFPVGVVPPPGLAEHDDSAHLVDVNGDGVSDLIQCAFNGTDFNWYLKLWTPAGFDPQSTLISRLSWYPCNAEMHTIDVDADGKVDLLVQGVIIHGDGAEFQDTFDALSYLGGGEWERRHTGLHTIVGGRLLFLDVNGDGLPDAVKMPYPIDPDLQDEQQAPTTSINTGAGFAPEVKSLTAWPPGQRALTRLATAIDYNADGLQDVLIPMRVGPGKPDWVVLQATGTVGDGTFQSLATTIDFDVQINGDEVTLAHPEAPRVTDLDGDGNQDLVLAEGPAYHTFKSLLGEEDVLASVTDGMNARDPADPGYLPNVQISYAHLVDKAATVGLPEDPAAREPETYLPRHDGTEGECAYPIRCVVGPRRVVSGYVLNNGADHPRHFQVAWRNGRYHRLGRGFLGFGERIVRDLDTGAGTAEFYDNATYDADLETFPYAGTVVREWRWNPSLPQEGATGEQPIELLYRNNLLQTVKTVFDQSYFVLPAVRSERREQGSYAPGGVLTVEQYVAESEAHGADVLGHTIRVINDHDQFGGVLSETTFTDGVDLELTVLRQYSNDEAKWLIGLPTSQNECSSALSIQQCRGTTWTYDSAGRVATQSATNSAGDPGTQVTLTFVHDALGNIMATMAEDGFGDHRASCTSYDVDGVFPYAHKSPAGHVSYMRFDRGLGVQTADVDPNQLATRWAHDGFGRVTQELRPDGTATSYTLTRTKDGGQFQNQWNVKLETATPGLQDDTVQYDSLGRPIAWWTQGVHVPGQPSERIVQIVAFDDRGEHIELRSVPTGESTPPLLRRFDRFEYDGMGRMIRHRTPWDAETTYRYAGAKVVVTTPGDVVTEIENDGLGRPVTISDPAGKTHYEYGPFGGLWTVTDPGGAVTVTERDEYGRVVLHTDPDRGKTEAQYNGFGQRVSETDAAGRHVEYHHDALGRTTERVDQDGTTTWKWDVAAHGIGKIAAVESPDGHVVGYTYDALGRPQARELTLDGETFASSLGYDAFGRVETITYPQGAGVAPFAVRRQYDAYGHLLAARDAANNTPFWQLLSTDGAGRILTESFGNGILTTTTRSYFSEKNRLKSIYTTAGGTVVQNLSYTYDQRLNLTSRKDARQNLVEWFQYDDLDRITCADFQLSLGCAKPIKYGANGNILSKPGIGDYTYDPDHPHAVLTAGVDSFQYDDVGNQTARPGATIEYTAFDLPKTFTLSQGAGTIELDYDGDQARIRKTTLHEQTVYFGDLYERVHNLDTGAIEHRYSVHSSERVVAVVTRSAGAPSVTKAVHVDHLGSVDVLTNSAGVESDRRSYDIFGARRNPIWNAPPPAAPFLSTISPGFTGHEGDDELGLVNMRGRLYDPKVGRFLTTDPIISQPGFGQSWNPYSYALNNPLAYVDPSGFSVIDTSEVPADDVAPDGPPAVEVPAPPVEPAAKETAQQDIAGTIEIFVIGKLLHFDGPRQAGDAGSVVAPIDVQTYGNTAGIVPARDPTAPGAGESPIEKVAEIGLGITEGEIDLAKGIAEDLVLNALTFGGYGTYKLGSALWAGYKEDGVLGAVNAANPLFHIAMGGLATYQAIENDDYRAAGAAGVQTVILGVATAVGAADTLKALAGGGAAAARNAVAGRREMHHTIPREIRAPRSGKSPLLPREVAEHPDVRGRPGLPNRWSIPRSKHRQIHPEYNRRFKAELRELKGEITVEDVLRIRDKLVEEFGIDQ